MSQKRMAVSLTQFWRYRGIKGALALFVLVSFSGYVC